MSTSPAAMRRDVRAATSIEYALIASLIAIVLIAGVKAVGTNVNSKYNAIAAKVTNPN